MRAIPRANVDLLHYEAPARLRLAAARSSGLKSFAGLISAHNARQQVRAPSCLEETQYMATHRRQEATSHCEG